MSLKYKRCKTSSASKNTFAYTHKDNLSPFMVIGKERWAVTVTTEKIIENRKCV